jgi:hypothetical protein
LIETKRIIEAAACQMADLGVHWDRVHLPGIFSWNIVERSRGKYDWTLTDALVKIAQKHKIRLSPNVWPYAAWDQEAYSKQEKRKVVDRGLGSGAQVPVDSFSPIPQRYGIPYDLNAYKAWLVAMTERYDGDNHSDMPGLRYPIKHWEIAGGYRAIVPFFFTGTPREFVTLLKSSYVAIKGEDPDSKIINAGPVSLSKMLGEPATDLDKDPETVFFEETLKLGCGDFFDVLSIMVNGLGESSSLMLINYYKDLLSKYTCEKPIWISEIASHCGEGNFMGQVLPYRTPEEQAIDLVKHLVIAFSAGVSKAFWTALGPAVPKGAKLSEPLESVGYIDMVSLLDGQGKGRPAYHTFKLMISLLDKFRRVTPLRIEGAHAYRFDLKDRGIIVLWGDIRKRVEFEGLKSRNIVVIGSVPKMEKGKVVPDKQGQVQFNKESMLTKDGKVSLQIGKEPLFVQEI